MKMKVFSSNKNHCYNNLCRRLYLRRLASLYSRHSFFLLLASDRNRVRHFLKKSMFQKPSSIVELLAMPPRLDLSFATFLVLEPIRDFRRKDLVNLAPLGQEFLHGSAANKEIRITDFFHRGAAKDLTPLSIRRLQPLPPASVTFIGSILSSLFFCRRPVIPLGPSHQAPLFVENTSLDLLLPTSVGGGFSLTGELRNVRASQTDWDRQLF